MRSIRLNLLLFIIGIIALPAAMPAQPKRYMRCLALEEAKIHKENAGMVVYRLNQDIIGALVQLRESIFMKSEFVKEVCDAPYPSIKTLELLMTNEKLFFSRYTEDGNIKGLAVDQAVLEDLRAHSAILFAGFVAKIQASLGRPDCLQKHIPELNRFFEEMRYLQENMGLGKIVKSLENPATIFDKLQKLNYGKIEC